MRNYDTPRYNWTHLQRRSGETGWQATATAAPFFVSFIPRILHCRHSTLWARCASYWRVRQALWAAFRLRARSWRRGHSGLSSFPVFACAQTAGLRVGFIELPYHNGCPTDHLSYGRNRTNEKTCSPAITQNSRLRITALPIETGRCWMVRRLHNCSAREVGTRSRSRAACKSAASSAAGRPQPGIGPANRRVYDSAIL